MSEYCTGHARKRRYSQHQDPAIRLLWDILETLPIRSLEHDIVSCAMLYLEGDLRPGGSVQRWWRQKIFGGSGNRPENHIEFQKNGATPYGH